MGGRLGWRGLALEEDAAGPNDEEGSTRLITSQNEGVLNGAGWRHRYECGIRNGEWKHGMEEAASDGVILVLRPRLHRDAPFLTYSFSLVRESSLTAVHFWRTSVLWVNTHVVLYSSSVCDILIHPECCRVPVIQFFVGRSGLIHVGKYLGIQLTMNG